VVGLEHLRAAPIVDVHLWYPPDALPGWDFAALIGSPVQWVFRKEAGYLCCSLSAAGAAVSMAEADLVDLCVRELAAAVPALVGVAPLHAGAVRDPEATILAPPGARRPGSATVHPNVVLAGAWTDTGWPATMESAVRSGRAAARLVAERVGGLRRAA